MYKTTGILQYGPGIRAVIWADQAISDYYRKLIPKYYYAQPQMYKAHITVVRTNKETPKNMSVWGKYAGEEVDFTYESEVNTDGVYFYLKVYSDRIGDIREELGLSRYRFNDITKNAYHMTIGNCKGN